MTYNMDESGKDPYTETYSKSRCISKTVFLKLFILSIVGCLNYFSMGLHSYNVNEWTQHMVKQKYFGNRTFSANFSACEKTNKSDPDYITYTHVQQETARWQIYNTVASTVPAFITAVIYPSYTDAFGRKYLFILSLTGIFLQFFIDALTILFSGSLVFIVLGAFMFGITGTSYCLLSAMFTYIADVTESGKQRTAAITVVESFLLIMSTSSGLVAGFFIDATGFTYPGITSACMSFATLLIVVFLLPETLPQGKRQKRLPVHKSVKRVVDFYLSSDFKGKRSLYILLIVSFIVLDLCSVHRRSLEVLYQLGMPFCWGPKKIGYFAALTNVGQSVASIGLVTLLQKCLSDVSIGMLASFSNACSLVLEGFANTDLLLYLGAYSFFSRVKSNSCTFKEATVPFSFRLSI